MAVLDGVEMVMMANVVGDGGGEGLVSYVPSLL